MWCPGFSSCFVARFLKGQKDRVGFEGLYASQDEKEFLGVGDSGEQFVIRHVENPAFTSSII
jgi:hypothetical protein